MAFLQKRKIKGKVYYYIDRSVRVGGSVKKVSKCLGAKKPTKKQITEALKKINYGGSEKNSTTIAKRICSNKQKANIKLGIAYGRLKGISSDAVIIPVFKDVKCKERLFIELDNRLDRLLSRTIYEKRHICEDGNLTPFFVPKSSGIKIKQVILAGFGASKNIEKDIETDNGKEKDNEAIRVIGGSIAKYSKTSKLKSAFFVSLGKPELDMALIEGFLLGNYNFDEYKTKKEDNGENSKEKRFTFKIISDCASEAGRLRAAAAETEIICSNVNLVRDLVNKPANIINPISFADEIKKIFAKTSVKVDILEYEKLKKHKMNCIIAVGQGSTIKPRLAVLKYKGNNAKKSVALVGKGVTYDSGGINIKPTPYLIPMKDDMAGAAAVVGIVKAAYELCLPLNVTGVMPLVENMPSGSAIKPGDVIIAANKKSIEIENTDAEGRLILADSLHYAVQQKPDVIIDIATLTGASLIALGSLCSTIMGNDKKLIEKIINAGKETHELAWELPLIKEYEEDIKSDIADLKNIGAPTGEAGTIIGGIFLRNFIEKCKWAHIDIGATVWSNSKKSYNPKGATGVPVRMVVKFLKSMISKA